MTLQSDLAARFLARDRESGATFLMMVLVEEVGELAEAVRRGEPAGAKAEVADVAFLAYALANVLDIDLDAAIRRKFLERAEGDVTRSWTDLPDGAR